MTRWMALDVGAKTVGVAITDPLKVTVRPLLTLRRHGLSDDLKGILDLIRQHDVERLIVGRPRHLGGEESEILEVIEPLAKRLEEISGLKIEWVDERLSTKEAEELMAEAGLRAEERRKRRNEFAAALILKRYLEESK